MWFNSTLTIIKCSCIRAILTRLIDVFKLNIYAWAMSIRLNPCQLYFCSIDLMGSRSITHTCRRLTFVFFYCRTTRDAAMMRMMIRHTAQSGTVRSSLTLRFLLIYLSRYPLLSFLARPSCAHYHNSDISLFFAVSLPLASFLTYTDSTPSCERGWKKERSATLMNSSSSLSLFLSSVQHTFNTHKFSFPA